jgi:hypothetical protein
MSPRRVYPCEDGAQAGRRRVGSYVARWGRVWVGLGALGCGAPQPPEELVQAHAVAVAVAERVERELDCEASNARFLCPLRGIGELTPAALPRGDYLGVVGAVRASRPLERSMGETARAAALRVGEGAAKAQVLEPATPDDQRVQFRAVSELVGYLRGENEALLVSPAVDALYARMPEELAPLTSDERGAGYLGETPVRLYLLPGFAEGQQVVVSVEVLAGGSVVGVFPIEARVVGEAPPPVPEPEFRGPNVEVVDGPVR